ncbi:MAG TPA: 2-dehydropantoate 2-reductase [Candidatus Dormibacteraeota bacterium]
MRVCVVGAGGIGMVYAGRLAEASGPDRELVLMTRRPDARHAAAAGLTVERPRRPPTTHAVPARLEAEIEPGSQDVVILTTKTFDNAAVLPAVARILRSDGGCLSIQNGIANLELMRSMLGKARAFRGATGVGATALGKGRVLETSVHSTWIPSVMPHAESLARWLQLAGLEPMLVDGAERVQWHKAAIGGLSGGLAVLLDMPFGQVIRRPACRTVLREMLHEIVAVARACGVDLDVAEEELEQERMLDVAPPEAMTSIYTDYRHGRPTELADQIEPILALADRHRVPLPIVRTLYALTQEKVAARLTAR